MPKLSAIVEDRADLPVKFGAETVSVVYRPAVYDEDFNDLSIQNEWAKALSRILLSWDLLDDDGQPYATDEPTLRTISAAITVPILRAIHADMAPNLRRAETSGAGSAPVAPLALTRNGTPS